MKPSAYPALRRWVQTCVLVLILLAAYLAWPGHGSPQTPPFQGTTWAGSVFGVKLMDPLAGVESLLSGSAAAVTILLAVLIPVLATLLLGKIFCSWICPAGFLFELGDSLRNLLGRWGFRSRGHRVWRETKYVILALGLVFTILGAGPVLGGIYPPALMGRELHGAVFAALGRETGPAGPMFTGAAMFLFMILITEAMFSPRTWCRNLCPGGALYALLGARRVVRVKRRPSVCTDCALCVPACPMGLNPMKGKMGLNCDNCLECVASCPDGALYLGVGFREAPPKEGLHEV